MLKEITGNNMIVICNNCKAENTHDLTIESQSFGGVWRIRKYFNQLSSV